MISAGRFRAALLTAGLVAVLAGPTSAEHEIFYRFVVLGYVRDARGTPVASAQLELIRDKTGFSYLGESGPDGFYLIIARLGDESVGERLTLRLGKSSTAITARFDPANHADHRGTRVDVVDGAFRERATAFTTTLAHYLGTQIR